MADILELADEELSRRSAELAADLERNGLPTIERVSAAWKSTDAVESTALLESVLEDFLRWLRHADTLERSVIARIDDTDDNTTDYSQGSPSRKELVSRALGRLDEEVVSKLATTVNIKRVRVDEFAAPIPADQPWAIALAAPHAPIVAEARDVASPDETGIGPSTNLTAAIDLLRQDAAAESISAAVLYSDGRTTLRRWSSHRPRLRGWRVCRFMLCQ